MEEFIIANCTDSGIVRSVNEDSMTTFDSPNGRVVVVCDGMGGQNAGDVASQLAVTVIQDILTDNKFNSPEEAITKSIVAANQAMLMRASQDMSLSGMGSTCVMLIISEGKVYYGSVGDSRIYYIANGMIRQLTKDQSYVQTLVDAGELSQEAAEHHKDKNQITNALGIEGMTPPVIGQIPITPEPGCVFLLCSDGLSGMISNSLINQVVSNPSLNLQEKAKELVKLANSAGGIDNITVQLVEFPKTLSKNGIHPSNSSGKRAANKSVKNRAALYWSVTVVCLILAIGGVTYWLIPDDGPKPKSETTIKSETKENNRNTVKSSPNNQLSTTPPKEEEQSHVDVIETIKSEKPKKVKPKNKIEKKIEQAKDTPKKPIVEEEEQQDPVLRVTNKEREKYD